MPNESDEGRRIAWSKQQLRGRTVEEMDLLTQLQATEYHHGIGSQEAIDAEVAYEAYRLDRELDET